VMDHSKTLDWAFNLIDYNKKAASAAFLHIGYSITILLTCTASFPNTRKV
jgi:hypothetical protein